MRALEAHRVAFPVWSNSSSCLRCGIQVVLTKDGWKHVTDMTTKAS